MTFLKRTAAAVLGGAILCTTSAFAVEATNTTKPNQAVTQTAPNAEAAPAVMAERNLYYGKIKEIIREDDKITGLHMESESEGEYVFHVNEETMLLDSGTGTRTGIDTLKVGDGVYVYHSPAVTMSLPPQSYAEAILTNMPQDARAAMLHTVEDVQKKEDGSVVVTTDRGTLELTIEKDAVYTDFMGRQIMGADDLRIGTRFFAWYDVVQESLPAQAGTKKLTVASARTQDNLSIVVGDKTLEGVTAKIENGTLMIPAGAVSKEFGLTASYEKLADGEQVTLKGDKAQMVMDIGSDTFQIEKDAAMSYGAPAIITEGTTWMPAQALADLVGADLSLSTGAVAFSTTK